MRRLYLLVALAACQSADPDLSSTEQELVSVTPLSHDFGSLQIGQQTGAFTVTVNPGIGAQDDLVTAVSASCPDFTIDAENLPFEVYRICEVCAVVCFMPCTTQDSQSYTFDTYFHPTVAGTVSCAVTITTNGTTNRTITLTGTGTVPPIDIDVQPGSVAFGDVRRDTDSSGANVVVRNLGGSTLSVSSASVTGPYTMAGPTSYSVGPGGSMTHSLVCHPTAVGSAGGSFVVTSDDPLTPTVSIPLSCNGIDSNIGITPSPAVLPTTRVGEPIMQTITIDNSGAAGTTLNDVEVTGDIQMISKPPPNTPLGPGASAQVQVMFPAAAQGDASATLNITYDGGMMRTSQITAKAQLASMSLTPDGEVDLGPVCSGQVKTQTFTLLGNADGPFSLTSISSPQPPFTLTPPTLPSNVLGLGATQISFDVTAAPLVAGFAQSTVTIGTDIPNGATHDITVDVEGLDVGIGATPVEVDLGSQPVDTTTIGQTATLTNCTTTPVTFSNPRIEGADATEFAIVQQPPELTVDATASASWLIVLTAHSRGLKSATFSVDYDGGTAIVPLIGEGLAPAGPGRDSYYACSASGSPLALWPMGLAIVVVTIFRRRRR